MIRKKWIGQHGSTAGAWEKEHHATYYDGRKAYKYIRGKWIRAKEFDIKKMQRDGDHCAFLLSKMQPGL